MIHRTKTLVVLLVVAFATMAPVCVLSGGNTTTTSSSIELSSNAIVEVIGENAELRITRSLSRSLDLKATFHNSEFVDYYTQSLSSGPSEHFIISATTSTGGQTTANSILELAIPNGVTLIVRTTNRPVSIADVTLDSADISTTDGKIAVRGSAGDFDLSTTNSEVLVQSVAGLVNVSTTNAHVWFDGVVSEGSNSIATSNGDVAVRLRAGSDVFVSGNTHNGDVTVNEGDSGVIKDGDKASFEHQVLDGTASFEITNGPGAIHINPDTIAVFDGDS
jgi:hypothetical protein